MVAVPSTAAAAAVPSTARVAAIPADRDHRDGDHCGTHRWDEAGGGSNSNSNSSQGGNTSSSNNANNSQSGSNGSSLVELNNVLENSLDGISIHVLGG
jgi:hypothetical protein